MPRILVTGAAGFIGSFVVNRFATSHEVYAIARHLDGKTNSSVNWIQADLTSIDCQAQLPHDIDCVIHLAQSKQYRDFPSGSIDMKSVNIDATFRLLEWARKSSVKHFIFTSTANVYQRSTELLTEMHPAVPGSFYAASKLSSEYLIRQYQEFFHIDILRLFTVYGPGQQGMLIPNIATRILTEQPVELVAGIGVYLSPVFVGNVVDVIHHLLNNPFAPNTRLMNLCGDQVTSLAEIVNTLEKIIGKDAVLKITDGEPPSFIGSNECLKKHLSFNQFIDMQSGLELTFPSNQMFL